MTLEGVQDVQKEFSVTNRVINGVTLGGVQDVQKEFSVTNRVINGVTLGEVQEDQSLIVVQFKSVDKNSAHW